MTNTRRPHASDRRSIVNRYLDLANNLSAHEAARRVADDMGFSRAAVASVIMSEYPNHFN